MPRTRDLAIFVRTTGGQTKQIALPLAHVHGVNIGALGNICRYNFCSAMPNIMNIANLVFSVLHCKAGNGIR